MWALLSPVMSNLVLVANRRTPLYMGTLHITLAVLPVCLNSVIATLESTFWSHFTREFSTLHWLSSPVFLNFALMANQLTSFWPVCVCLYVGKDAFLSLHCNLHFHTRVSSRGGSRVAKIHYLGASGGWLCNYTPRRLSKTRSDFCPQISWQTVNLRIFRIYALTSEQYSWQLSNNQYAYFSD